MSYTKKDQQLREDKSCMENKTKSINIANTPKNNMEGIL
ncbi:hypothetical protein IGJ55_002718 [Enterococcus sp. AZ170]|nr:hypothetical protein [Enterococcus ureilyticus]